MRRWVVVLAVHGGLALAQTPLERVFWKPDPARWTLKVEGIPGGWRRDPSVSLRITLEDPRRPVPPPEWRGMDYWDRRQARHQLEEAALEARVAQLLPPGSDSAWQSASGGEGDEDGWHGEEGEGSQPWPDVSRLAALKAARAQLEGLQEARRFDLKAWFNGRPVGINLQVGEPGTLTLRSEAGENRFAFLEPGSRKETVFTWHFEGTSAPLVVRTRALEGSPYLWNLRVLDPKGKLHDLDNASDFDWAEPGTWTVQWDSGHPSPWWDASDAVPRRIHVEATLFGGTDRERRRTFECLALPGSGLLTLGSFDVEP
jgi:hypothetical protein